MHADDSPVERTPDLIAKIRALRDRAERDMNRFTTPADYDVRRVVGRKPKAEAVEAPLPAPVKKRVAKKTVRASIEFVPIALERPGDPGDPA